MLIALIGNINLKNELAFLFGCIIVVITEFAFEKFSGKMFNEDEIENQ